MKVFMEATLWCALVLLLGTSASAKITHRNIERNEEPLVQLEVPFGFETGGSISLRVQDLRLREGYTEALDASNLGFILSPVDRKQELFATAGSQPCYLDDEELSQVVYRFNDESLKKFSEGGDQHIEAVVLVKKAGLYALYFANCSPLPRLAVSYKIRVEMYNTYMNGSGERRDYLSVGEQELPMLYFVSSFFAQVSCPELMCTLHASMLGAACG